LQKLGAALTEAQVNLNEFTEAEKAAFSVAKIEDYIATIKSYEDKISLREQQLSEFNTLHTEVVSYEAKLQAASDNLAVYHEELAALAAEQESLYASFPERLKALIKTTPNFEEAKAVLSQKNKDYLELKVKTMEMRKQADVLKHRLQDIEKKIQLDHDKRDVIKDLQLIVTAFSRGGIPMAYVQHKFDNLVAMTQENLEIMEANFAIMPHKTKPVSLQFYRTDEPGQVVFDHDKLSGGQKVRLSIAFLLAVQQLVIPDLGLLVLDEPSTHLDKEGKENLKELLLNMGQQMDNSDNQLIVCDHAEELEPAFKHFISFYDN
jgi:DNA repair exonuclease SbcCD ATPase subunit